MCQNWGHRRGHGQCHGPGHGPCQIHVDVDVDVRVWVCLVYFCEQLWARRTTEWKRFFCFLFLSPYRERHYGILDVPIMIIKRASNNGQAMLVKTGTSWYQLAPSGTSWCQLVPADTNCDWMEPAGANCTS